MIGHGGQDDCCIKKSPQEWKKELPPQAYRVLREHGTEPPFANAYFDKKDKGVYHCAGCGAALFSSRHKYDSGTGWPSFTQPMDEESISTTKDSSLMMERIEVHCRRCGGHLGHVFPDGPRPTGLRYCLNSAALDFRPSSTQKGE